MNALAWGYLVMSFVGLLFIGGIIADNWERKRGQAIGTTKYRRRRRD